MVAAWFAFAPGLTGNFLFDDWGNLPALGARGAIDNSRAFLYYVTSGIADPTGRPLAMASFLVDANNWPADPEPFKRTNILIHLLNGALLCALLLRLGRQTPRDSKSTDWAAVLGSGLWLLHPLWASTVLYVVQREAMLSTSFVLLGLLAYLHGRDKITESPRVGSAWVVCGVGLCTLLSVLCKANGALLPLLVVVLEWIFMRQQPGASPPPRALLRCLTFAIYPTAGAIVIYLAYAGIQGFVQGMPSFRPWTLGQRLLTEPRVLLDYLRLLIVPRPLSSGLFNDAYPVSQDSLHPWTTLPSLLAIVGLFVTAIASRKCWPALALGIVFYFAGHLLESTTIPLELYFEHRNYLPSIFLFWALAMWLCNGAHWRTFKAGIAVIALLVLTTETFAAASLWGNTLDQARIWALKNPDSPRAQAYAANIERANGHVADAAERLRHVLRQQPGEIQLAVNLLGVDCQRGQLPQADLRDAEQALRSGVLRGPLAFDWLEQGIALVREGSCTGLSLDGLQRLIDAARENPRVRDLPRFNQSADHLEGRIALARGDETTAVMKFRSALATAPSAEAALSQAALLGSYHLPRAALQQLDDYQALADRDAAQPIRNMQSLHEWLLRRDGYWQNEITHMRAVLNEDLQQAASTKPQTARRAQ